MQTKDNKENLTEILSLLWDNVGTQFANTEDNTITWVCDEENRYHMHIMYRQWIIQSNCMTCTVVKGQLFSKCLSGIFNSPKK